ncbi:hypothetical protein A2767_00490 [Candidatus Roizmanbacteria bacterium RIFCSPHIGHO2_01_FULL_35_10]|uniref:Solute-binding protein family 5 domain-containing protein n=1 Tax=Candidatus Roizmanbacteria bacterium RIFCSPLOWO2_01_FULL_35_13 TaxID=1802055 RepID=A0A1F7IHI1_9BACT|nr:MAG: hypothetical protein A2767_00490 [Candidatus Roizmanbacteria bacterium RIFCSPHIGHO2_01_FULL_35_10]OGK42817.1 MAG: hypothetical protein A3A74_01255 [Candidatus Roizmanbacteria bacterium RIFCSPLOWO2_01_FULL_35_13]
MFLKKTFRYYYWLTAEFIKKNLRIIALSFFLSFLLIITLISFAPYISTFFLTKKEVIGLLGVYDFNNLPDEITSKISNGLLYINEKGEFIPAIASNWEVSEDGKEYRFHLRDNLIWSNGKKFSAHDINYDFKDIKTEVIDDKTIYFKLSKALPIFPTYLKKAIIQTPLQGIAGLYKVDRLKLNFGNISEITLNPNKKDLPLLVYKFYKDEAEITNAYKRGEINKMTVSKKSVADNFKNWRNSTLSKTVDYSRLMTLFFNFDNEFLRDKDVRQAIIMAVDGSKLDEFGEVAFGPVTPISWAYNSNLKNPVFDPVAAEKILKKSRNSSNSAELNLFTYYDYLDNAEEISKNLDAAGLPVKLKLVSSEKPNNFDLFLAFWNVPVDPDQYFFWHSTQPQGNLGNYKNVKIDLLLEQARNTSVIDERKKFYLEFQKIIVDDPPAAFLYFPYIYTIKRK